ncbi:hypothetical protein RYX56_21475, partial [Alkalihalophilus lindianensis]|nr:hypothetical protein [Alkalihalophilus lindianensis]
TKAGIVGPKNTVEMVLEISEEYKEKLRIFPFIYQNPEEAIEIVNKNQYMVDIWIFAGPVLQPIVEQSQSKQPFFFLQLDGASLTKTLVEIGYKDQQKLDNLSIDIIPKRDVYEIFMDLKLPQES